MNKHDTYSKIENILEKSNENLVMAWSYSTRTSINEQIHLQSLKSRLHVVLDLIKDIENKEIENDN